MKKFWNWFERWLFLPLRLLYLPIYYLLSKIFGVKNEGFKIYYDKKQKVILSGWTKFYDADRFWKTIVLSTLEISIVLCIIILHLFVTGFVTGSLIVYGFLYLYVRFNFLDTLVYLRNWKCNRVIRKYVGEELYYYAKWNLESLFTIFPELVHLEKINGKCVSFGNSSELTLQMCKEIWESTKPKPNPETKIFDLHAKID